MIRAFFCQNGDRIEGEGGDTSSVTASRDTFPNGEGLVRAVWGRGVEGAYH